MSKIRSKRIVINHNARLFIQDGKACFDPYTYHSCLGISDINLPKTPSVVEYCASDTQFNQFIESTRILGDIEPGDTTIATNFSSDASVLKTLFDSNCRFKMQIHIGFCQHPQQFAEYDKALCFYDVELTNYSISPLIVTSSADREVVTETADLTFSKVIEVTLPNFNFLSGNLISDGPIIDSFIFCEEYCQNCYGNEGIYLVQLVSCDVDCVRLRVIYSKDGVTWNVVNANLCDTIPCAQLINTNIAQDDNFFYNIAIEYLKFPSVHKIVNTSFSKLNKTLLFGNKILGAKTKNDTIFYYGESGRLFVDSGSGFTRMIDSHLDISTDLLSLDTQDGINFVIGATNNRLYTGTSQEISMIALPFTGDVRFVKIIEENKFLLSTNTETYLYCNGRVRKPSGIFGAIVDGDFYNEDIGCCVTVASSGIFFWQTIDGGFTWKQTYTLTRDYVVTTVKICPTNHNKIIVSGRKMPTVVTVSDYLNPILLWDCTGTGFTLTT